MPPKRAHTLVAVLVCLAVACAAPRALAAADPASLPPKLDDAVARGLEYLARQQNPDGSFTAGRNPDGTPGPVAAPPMAMTGLALMAFLSAGHAPDVGRHGLVVRGAIDFLVAKVPDDGYVGAVKGDKGDDSRMYGQGIVALALAEAYGVEDDRERRMLLRGAIVRMLTVILAAQSVPKSEVHAGGWRYTPDAPDSDLSLSGWNALALRACRDAGFEVPKDALERAARYVLKCRNPLDKGFAYQPGAPGQPGTTGIGVSSLYLLDAGARPETADAVKFLAQAGAQPPSRFPYYSNYHAVQAALHAGEPTWGAVTNPAFDRLITAQSPDGGWPASATTEEPGRAYASAMAVLTLTVPYRLLPIYRR